jgi:putative phosphoribosyl transferase
MQENTSTFADREDAGTRLGETLADIGIKADLVLAIPRGGVPVAMMIAKKFQLPFKLYLVRKIGHPFNDEYAIGAVTENELLLNESEKTDSTYLNAAIQKERERIREMKEKFGHVATSKDILGKKIVLVDDGIATGTCIQLAIREIRKMGAGEIIVAAPVCPFATKETIRQSVDKIIILKTPSHFVGIGAHYADFSQLTDSQVIELTKKSPEKATQ